MSIGRGHVTDAVLSKTGVSSSHCVLLDVMDPESRDLRHCACVVYLTSCVDAFTASMNVHCVGSRVLEKMWPRRYTLDQ